MKKRIKAVAATGLVALSMSAVALMFTGTSTVLGARYGNTDCYYNSYTSGYQYKCYNINPTYMKQTTFYQYYSTWKGSYFYY